MLNKILIFLLIVLAFVGGFATAVALLPDDFVASRKRVVDASPSDVFEQVNSLKNGNKWSPWMEEDKDAKVEFEGPDSGVGAVMKWKGNDKIGEGSQKIVESKPGEVVRTELIFVKPMQGKAIAQFDLRPIDGGKKTEVTWTMSDKHDFVSKAMCLVMKAKPMIEAKFDKGLENLNNVLTKKETKDAPK